jgi:23S rRNA pseudouridine1911/1915/1917 synthase
MAEIKIISSPDEKNPFLIIYKPSGLPSAPLKEGDESALTQALKLFPEIKNVKGKKSVEYGLLHRIDTATRGLLFIACTQECFDNMELQQKEGKFIKYYRAGIENKEGINKTFTLRSKFRTYGEKGREVRPVFENASAADLKKCGNKFYETEITIEGEIAFCKIREGFRHQVRAHLAFSGYPIKGDKIYNKNCGENDVFEFEAWGFEFNHPLTGKKVIVTLPEDKQKK